MLAGTDVLRFNFNYDSVEENLRQLKSAEKIRADLHAQVKYLADLPDNRIWFGDFSPAPLVLQEGQKITLKSGDHSDNPEQFIPVNLEKLGEKTYVGENIFINDGEMAVTVTEIMDKDTINVQTLNRGEIVPHRGFYINQPIDENKLLEAYTKIIKALAVEEPYYLSLPYVNENFHHEVVKILHRYKKWHPQIVIKIQHQEDLENLEKICEAKTCHGLIIDRGELGVNVPFEQLGVRQKEIMTTAKKFGKPVLVSTQILESTFYNYVPFRSDILDLTNIILDGADGIILCRETSVGPRPIYAISIAKKIIAEAEKMKNSRAK